MDDSETIAAGLDTSDSPATSIVLPARPEALRLDTRKTALIVVDMQNAYASAGAHTSRRLENQRRASAVSADFADHAWSSNRGPPRPYESKTPRDNLAR